MYVVNLHHPDPSTLPPASAEGDVTSENILTQQIGAIDADSVLNIQTGDGGLFLGTSGQIELDCNNLLLSSDFGTVARTLNAGEDFTFQDFNVRLTGVGKYFGDAGGLSNYAGIKIYRAILNQTGANPPVATVIENTLGGTLVWSRSSAGNYFGTLSGAFTADKTFILPRQMTANDTSGIDVVRSSANAVAVSGADDDLIPANAVIEIFVYP